MICIKVSVAVVVVDVDVDVDDDDDVMLVSVFVLRNACKSDSSISFYSFFFFLNYIVIKWDCNVMLACC